MLTFGNSPGSDDSSSCWALLVTSDFRRKWCKQPSSLTIHWKTSKLIFVRTMMGWFEPFMCVFFYRSICESIAFKFIENNRLNEQSRTLFFLFLMWWYHNLSHVCDSLTSTERVSCKRNVAWNDDESQIWFYLCRIFFPLCTLHMCSLKIEPKMSQIHIIQFDRIKHWIEHEIWTNHWIWETR